ncbi:MAG TPA: DUF4394 domain-containing protein [Steroidobacteraceae bacterium]|nr:DUF4394 domain-containing protein [Steroidobacteraceae bacterium]
MTFNSTTSALVYGAVSAALFMGAVSAGAQEAARQAPPSSAPTVQGRGVASGLTLPNAPIYALTSDNAIYVLRPGSGQYTRLGRVETDGGNLIGIDFRPADNTPTKLYGLTDLGTLYIIDVSAARFGQKTRVSTMNPRFAGGFENVMDFNPVANALRVTGSNDQNLAVVNGGDGSNLSTTVAQTKFVYAAGDVNAGKDPELTGGAYTNNFVGATATLFYGVDADTDTLVTIADKTATGSSNTGGGQLQTIGSFVDEAGNKLNMSPTTDLDVYTDRAGNNYLVGQTTRLLFTIDLSQINTNLKLGQTQRVVVKRGPPAPLPGSGAPLTGGVWDIAIPPQQ